MAKNMARIADGVVVNIEWWSDRQQQTETLIDIADRPVAIGDTFDGVDFFRNGEKILTELEQLRVDLADADAALAELGVIVNG